MRACKAATRFRHVSPESIILSRPRPGAEEATAADHARRRGYALRACLCALRACLRVCLRFMKMGADVCLVYVWCMCCMCCMCCI